MKNIRSFFLLIVICFCGCIDVSQNIVIKKDGSGSVELNFVVLERTISQIKTMRRLEKEMMNVSAAAASARGKAIPVLVRDDILSRHFDILLDPTEDRIRKEMKQYEKDGISIEYIRVSAMNAQRVVKIDFRFKDIKKAAQSDLFKAHWPFTLSRTDEGNYQFRSKIDVGGKTTVSSRNPAARRSLFPLLSGFKAALKVTVPGVVLRTNATLQSKFSGVWRYDFNKDPNAFNAFQNCDMKLLFDGNNLDLPNIIAIKSKNDSSATAN